MIERDSILRMIQQLSAALAKVLFRIEQKQLPEAFHEIDDACKTLIGSPWKFLQSMSEKELIRLFGAAEHPDKLMAASELLMQASRLLALQGKSDESFLQGVKAFSLFTELLLGQEQHAKLLSVREFALLLKDLEQYELPDALELKRSRFYELTGDFAAAGNVLGALIERDPAWRQEGVACCRRLEKLSDPQLSSGGISRSSISEWLRSWEGARAVQSGS